MTLMRGAHSVRYILQQFLEKNIPLKVAEAQAQWGIDYTIPDLEAVLPYEPVRMPHGSEPIIAISLGQARNFVTYDHTDSREEVYEVTYVARLFMWTFTPTEFVEEDKEIALVATMRARDDYAAIVRATLLGNQKLGQDDLIRIEETTLTESYSDVEQTSNTNVMIAAAFFDFEIKFTEYQYYENYGKVPASGVLIDAYVLPHYYQTEDPQP